MGDFQGFFSRNKTIDGVNKTKNASYFQLYQAQLFLSQNSQLV